MKKKILIFLLIVVIIGLAIALWQYGFVKPNKEVKVANETKTPEIVNIVPLASRNESFGFSVNFISQLECSKDKNVIYSLCGPPLNKNQSECVMGVVTVYLGYLYKTQQKGNFDYVIEMIMEKGGVNISKDSAIKMLQDFLNTAGDNEELPGDLRIWKSSNEDTIIQNAENDADSKAYFNNILIYKRAVKTEDCNKTEITEEDHLYSLLVQDACRLTFVSDKESYCAGLNQG